MNLRLWLLVGALVAGGLFLAPRSAQAYPQFQFSSGTQRCAQCHYSPAGFGLLTSWGRDEAADTLALERIYAISSMERLHTGHPYSQLRRRREMI